jgi:hypothetical protein
MTDTQASQRHAYGRDGSLEGSGRLVGRKTSTEALARSEAPTIALASL